MKLQHVLWLGVFFLVGPIVAMAIEQQVYDAALVPQNPAGTIAINTTTFVLGQITAGQTSDLWTIQPDGSSLSQFAGPGPNYAKYSPDGEWLYFQSNMNNPTGRWTIYRSPIDGSATYSLLPDTSLGDCYGFNFAAHPDPTMPDMVFVSAVGGVGRTGTMELNGWNTQVFSGLGYAYMGSMSPNAREIVFSHTADNYKLKRMNSDGTNVVSLAPNLPQSYMGQFTPDGQTIVFMKSDDDTTVDDGGDLYSVGRDGSNLRRLTTGSEYTSFYTNDPTGTPGSGGSTDPPDISPDGQQIAYISRVAGYPQVYVMDIDGANQRQLTDLPWACARVKWSPKGDELAFLSFDSAGRTQLFLTDLTGGTPRQLTHFTDSSVSRLTWSSVVYVPEPGTLAMLIAGSLLIAGWARLRRLRIPRP